jgi:hypothetical protein
MERSGKPSPEGRARMKMETRRSRRVRETLLKAGIWAFLALFVFSILGVAIVLVK